MLQEFLEIEGLELIHEEKLKLMEREMALSVLLLIELEHIPMLYKWYCELSGCYEEARVQNTDQKGQFLFVVLFFCSPIALVDKKIISGVRDKLVQLLGFISPSVAPNLYKSIKSFYTAYKGYGETVDQLYDEFMNYLEEDGIIPRDPTL